MSPYKDFVESGSEEIFEKLEEKIKDKIGHIMVLYGIKEIFEKLEEIIDVIEKYRV